MQTKLITLTKGSVKNTYLSTSLLNNMLHADVIGGRNQTRVAAKQLSVDYGGGLISQTDVDGTKKILRDRKSVSAFMKRHRMQAGNQICITQTGPYALRVDPV